MIGYNNHDICTCCKYKGSTLGRYGVLRDETDEVLPEAVPTAPRGLTSSPLNSANLISIIYYVIYHNMIF